MASGERGCRWVQDRERPLRCSGARARLEMGPRIARAILLLAAFPVYLFASSTPLWKSLFPQFGNFTVPPAPVATPAARWQLRAPLSSPREAMAVTTLNGQIYVVGGLSGGAPVTTVEVYDPPSDRWSARAPKPTALQGAGAAVIGGRIYVPGGCDASDRPSNIMEVYDPQRDSWEPGVAMPQALCPYCQCGPGRKAHVFGGLATVMPRWRTYGSSIPSGANGACMRRCPARAWMRRPPWSTTGYMSRVGATASVCSTSCWCSIPPAAGQLTSMDPAHDFEPSTGGPGAGGAGGKSLCGGRWLVGSAEPERKVRHPFEQLAGDGG